MVDPLHVIWKTSHDDADPLPSSIPVSSSNAGMNSISEDRLSTEEFAIHASMQIAEAKRISSMLKSEDKIKMHQALVNLFTTEPDKACKLLTDLPSLVDWFEHSLPSAPPPGATLDA